MRRLPSIKTLSAVFSDKAREARRIMEMSRAELAQTDAGAARIRECYHAPQTWDVRMSVLNALGETHGIESTETTRGEYASYLNTGDMYASALIYWRGAYRVQNVGDFIEKMERQGVKFQ